MALQEFLIVHQAYRPILSMSDRIRTVLYFGLVVAVGTILKLWVLPFIDKHSSPRVQMIITAAFLAFAMSLITVPAYFFWSTWDPRSWWVKAVRSLLAAGWITLLVALSVQMIESIAVPWHDAPPKPIEAPHGIGVAICGSVVLVVSLVYLCALVTDEGSSGAQRFLDFKVFMIWFVGGVYLLISSRVLDPIIGGAFGESFGKRLHDLAGTDPTYSLLVSVPAIILASVVTFWHNARR